MWWFYAILSAFFAALTAIFAKVGITGVDTDLATAIRTAFILVIAWGIAIFRGAAGGMSGLNKTNWIFLALSGCATGLSWICYFKALQMGNVVKVAPVDKLSVAIAIILAVIFLREPLSLKQGLGAALIIAGSIVLIL